MSLPFSKNSIIFAPMEGITNVPYRNAISNLFPEWDYFFTDFIRVPSVGLISKNKLKSHLGNNNKTGLQLLVTNKGDIEHTCNLINELKINHIDLNFGCPSRTVNKHGGGAYLLQDINSLKSIVKKIRSLHHNTLTAKIRTGFHDDKNFTTILKMLEDEGVEAITIHARLRDQLYKGIADWKYIKQAVETVSIPVIGNGDIWTQSDITKIFNETKCHSVMIARGAMKTPWLPLLDPRMTDQQDLNKIRRKILPKYFSELYNQYKEQQLDEVNILKRFKAVSRYLFDDFENAEEVKRTYMRTKDLQYFLT
jgi:tRNA-dihydrouridine synthase B